MSNLPATKESTALTVAAQSIENMYVTLSVAGQLFGVPVLQVQDVLGAQSIAYVPLAPEEVLGSLNLRGRIVTAIDLRKRLELPAYEKDAVCMSVVVEHVGELFSLVVDQVGEVMNLSQANYEKNPPTLDARWQEVSDGIYRLDGELLIVLNIARLLRIDRGEE